MYLGGRNEKKIPMVVNMALVDNGPSALGDYGFHAIGEGIGNQATFR